MARPFFTAFIAVWVFALAVATIINGVFFLPALAALGALWLVAPRG